MNVKDLLLQGDPEHFVWATGIENTFVPQVRHGHRALDEYELMGHYDHWREDLALAGKLGVQALRWGVPWYRLEPAQGEFDWRWTDQVIPYMVEELGITPIIDLMHYGCPFWLRREFDNRDYPAAVAAYAAAFARRYRRWIRYYTPLNEALVNAEYCGDRGLWPPYRHGERGYIRVLLQLISGMCRTIEAIKQVDPQALMVHVEATAIIKAAHPDLEPIAAEDRLRRFLSYDLLTGRVDCAHPLYPWLVRNGASPQLLSGLVDNPAAIDIMGLNFYPQWNTREVYLNRRGLLAYRIVDREGSGFRAMLEDYYRRYGIPLMITETSAHSSHEERSAWLSSSLAAICELRAAGVPVLGYTWFPLFTMIDWRYRWGSGPIEDYRLDLGLYTLGDAGQRWQATPMVQEFRAAMSSPQQSVGTLARAGYAVA